MDVHAELQNAVREAFLQSVYSQPYLTEYFLDENSYATTSISERGRYRLAEDGLPFNFCVFKEQLLAFSNPQSVTISGTAHSLKRISESNGVAVFQKIAANLEITLYLRHSREAKKADGSQIIRHNIELTMTTWDVNGKAEITQTYAVSRSRVGADPAVVTGVLDALGVLIDAQSASIVDSDVGP